MPWAALAAILPMIGAGVGAAASSGDKSAAQKLQQDALQNILGTSTPDIEQMKLQLQQLKSAGQLNPELVNAISQDPSLLQQVQVDPRLKQAQMNALANLQQFGASGMRPEDKAALSQVQQQVASDENARQQSIMQNMQARGQGNAASELAARLSSSQAASNRSQQGGLDIAGRASQNALQAIMNAGSLGGQMAQQQFSQDTQKAAAQDAINHYNAMNAQQIAGTNVSAKNQAQQYNLANNQRIQDNNADIANKQQQYNKSLAQQDFENKFKKAAAVAGGQKDLSKVFQENAKQTQEMWSGMGKGAGQGAAGIGSS